jgi:beta-aspartyl-peptidase (threonine type)
MTALLFCLMPFTTIQPAERAVLVIHGGVGVMTDAEMKAEGLTKQDFEKVLAEALRKGHAAMTASKNPADGVEAAIRVMEDSPLFNAGKGAVLTRDGRAELDAAIMEGTMTGTGVGKRDPRKRAGAVTGLTHVKNPISAARAVMEMPESKHLFLAGVGAEDYVLVEDVRRKYAIEKVDNAYFWTPRRLKNYNVSRDEEALRSGAVRDGRTGTVGAVALVDGKLVAGTSTGGVSNKWPGRVGDCPVIGAGTYADDRACGVSCTGTGEVFIRHAVAHDVTARMRYKNDAVTVACRNAIDQLPDEDGGVGGLIALSASGEPAFVVSKNCDGMYRGMVTGDGVIKVASMMKEEWTVMK